ncbi:MAG: TolC family protein, partial [Candidatus Hydrogenedentes bacterium]|nr:TolC family protein [Candidatus Hydrogenedentota bacterium]
MKRMFSVLIVCLAPAFCAAADTAAQAEPGAQPPAIIEEAGPIIEAVEAFENAQGPAEAAPESATALDVRACVDMALAQNAQVLISEANVEAARARIGQARSQLLPQAKASTAFTHTELNTPETNKWLNVMNSLTEGSLGGGLGGGLGSGFGGASGGTLIDQIDGIGSSIGTSLVLSKLMGEVFPSEKDFAPDDDLRSDEFTVTQVIYAGGQIR